MLSPFKKSRLYINHSFLYKKKQFFNNKNIDLIALYERKTGNTLRKSGRAFVGKCPFHEDNHPSFVIYPDTNSVYCFSCNFSAKGSWFEKKMNEV